MMGLLLLLCTGLLIGRSWLESRAVGERREVVEVRGSVPSPGFHSVVQPVTVASAVAAAGGHSRDSRLVPLGSTVSVGPEGAAIGPMDKRLVFGLPIAVNTASQAALESVPGLGPVRAEAIVQARNSGGRFESLDQLTRVKGIGPVTVAHIRPFLTVD
jgi:competence protein ComEA